MSIPKTMRALVKSKPEPGLWLEDVPVPEIGINDVLIKVERTPSAAPICTSINGMRGRKDDPRADGDRA